MNGWRGAGLWLARRLDRAGPRSTRVVALSWLAVGMLSVLLGSGLAAAWSAVEQSPQARDDVDSSMTAESPASAMGQALRGWARQAMGAVTALGSEERPQERLETQALARLATDASPEGRLLRAYHAMQEGRSQQALQWVSELVRDHPEFSLAQMLYGDLLAARVGQPKAFGVLPQASTHPADRRLALREEARRRWSAMLGSPPPGHVPVEFVQVAADVRHAVAIDASRSRLYLFENGPHGLALKKDIYISVGKQGVGKRTEGDQRTPLGVYWITATYKGPMRDPRLGQAALGINYPNAWDRQLGRTGSGLFLHGVPPELLAHVPQATDGCVAMANDEATALLATLDPDTTPVLIAWELTWIDPGTLPSTHAGFLKAYQAWERARQSGDDGAARAWYDGRTPVYALPRISSASSPSIIAWQGDGAPMMVVNAAHPTIDEGQPGLWRQYWVQQDGQWRIFFDNVVTIRGNRQPLEGMRSAGQSRKSRERSG